MDFFYTDGKINLRKQITQELTQNQQGKRITNIGLAHVQSKMSVGGRNKHNIHDHVWITFNSQHIHNSLFF